MRYRRFSLATLASFCRTMRRLTRALATTILTHVTLHPFATVPVARGCRITASRMTSRPLLFACQVAATPSRFTRCMLSRILLMRGLPPCLFLRNIGCLKGTSVSKGSLHCPVSALALVAFDFALLRHTQYCSPLPQILLRGATVPGMHACRSDLVSFSA